jgi:DNA-binding NarL/FixJ family response regulator
VGLRCLLIDDSEEFLASAARLLASEGLEIAGTATSGKEALVLAGAVRAELALVDVQLGDENGIQVAREIAERVPGITIVLVSTHSEDTVSDLLDGSTRMAFLPKTAVSASAILALARS